MKKKIMTIVFAVLCIASCGGSKKTVAGNDNHAQDSTERIIINPIQVNVVVDTTSLQD